MGEDEWRREILGKMWDELDGRPGGTIPDVLWELAGEAAFTDSQFQRRAAETALEHLKQKLFLVDDLAPLRFHPNAFWLLLAMAELEAPRLQRLARRKALEGGWVGEWEAWLIRLLQRSHPDWLGKLSVPLRQRLDAAAEQVREAAAEQVREAAAIKLPSLH
ncbi:MAG TPA: hypothetical protein VLV83_01430 [Acidobacteriota bacterium]|nr:hypothetical protein [Acidobacteriota bacterium]